MRFTKIIITSALSLIFISNANAGQNAVEQKGIEKSDTIPYTILRQRTTPGGSSVPGVGMDVRIDNAASKGKALSAVKKADRRNGELQGVSQETIAKLTHSDNAHLTLTDGDKATFKATAVDETVFKTLFADTPRTVKMVEAQSTSVFIDATNSRLDLNSIEDYRIYSDGVSVTGRTLEGQLYSTIFYADKCSYKYYSNEQEYKENSGIKSVDFPKQGIVSKYYDILGEYQRAANRDNYHKKVLLDKLKEMSAKWTGTKEDYLWRDENGYLVHSVMINSGERTKTSTYRSSVPTFLGSGTGTYGKWGTSSSSQTYTTTSHGPAIYKNTYYKNSEEYNKNKPFDMKTVEK
jgi:hypothetical protein